MKCKDCDIEMFVTDGGLELLNDDTPELQTEVYSVLKFYCRNEACRSFGKEIAKSRVKVY